MSSLAEKADCEKFAGLLKVNEEEVTNYLGNLVRDSVEATLNTMLEAEADALTKARRYERSPERVDTRAGHYDRKLLTKAGEVTLQMPRLRHLPFETEIIERYRRRESSVEEEAEQDATNEINGEGGSNVFYLGIGTAGHKDCKGNDEGGQGLVMSIYSHDVYTIADYQQHIIDIFYTAKAAQADGADVSRAKFQITRVREVVNPINL